MKHVLLFTFCISVFISTAQVSFKKYSIKSSPVQKVDPRALTNDYQAQLINLEAPSPDGDSYKSFLMRQKRKVREMYPPKNSNVQQHQKTNAIQPNIGKSMRMQTIINGTAWDVIGGRPSDNTLAVSDSGIVLCALNSVVWAYNINTDTTHFIDQIKSLRAIGGGSINNNDFDPKLLYDPQADRFILVYLQNNLPQNSRIKVCFSSSNDPEDPWYSYTLPGNPLNNNRWTDFPAISLTENELFLTVNLIIPGVSWQIGFDGSVIWQIDKEAGYRGDTVLSNNLWTDIKTDNRFIRNLHAVQGATGNAPEAFFLSNRNFDVINDTTFVLRVTGTIGDPNATLDIKVVNADTPYGVPPNGRQADTDPNDPTEGLQTNDARVLGAITNGDWIQYVANTSVPATGYSGIYHGFITNIFDQPEIKGEIISHPTRDFGYPNIAFTGDEACDIETVIGYDYTSPQDFPGVGMIYFGNDSLYSNQTDLKAGENILDRFQNDGYERWGDYFGIQRKFNEPKKVWAAGFFTNQNKGNSTWVAEVISQDTNMLNLTTNIDGSALFCDATLTATASGGNEPYSYSFKGEPSTNINVFNGLCEGDTIQVIVTDARGCSIEETIITTKTIAPNQPAAFPNPFQDRMVVQFSLPQSQDLTVSIIDEVGRVVEVILDQPAQAGNNELRFSLNPLRTGIYFLRVEGNAGFKYTEKIIKL